MAVEKIGGNEQVRFRTRYHDLSGNRHSKTFHTPPPPSDAASSKRFETPVRHSKDAGSYLQHGIAQSRSTVIGWTLWPMPWIPRAPPHFLALRAPTGTGWVQAERWSN